MPRALLLAALVSSCLSVAGATAVLVALALLRHKGILRHPSVKITAALASVDLVAAAQQFLPTWTCQCQWLCELQGALNQFFFTASFMWRVCAAHCLYRIAVKKDLYADKFMTYYHVFAWIWPLTSTVLAFATNAFGLTGVWCWIADDRQVFRWLMFYVPMIATMTYLTSVAILVQMKQRQQPALSESLLSRSSPISGHSVDLLLIVLAFVVIRIPSLLNRLYDLIFYGSDELFVLEFLHALCSPLQGFVNSLLFWNSKLVKGFLTDSNIQRGVEVSPHRLDDEEVSHSSFLSSFAQKAVSFSELSLVICTWNVGNQPFTMEMACVLFEAVKDLQSEIVVIGLQECTSDDWLEHLNPLLTQLFYSEVSALALGHMRLAIWSLGGEGVIDVSRCQFLKEATGLGKVVSNKGALGIAVEIHNYLFAFISCHLAAQAEKLSSRIENVRQILSRTSFGPSDISPDLCSRFHCLFLFGDLNFRLEGLEREEILSLIDDTRYSDLLECDQLTHLQRKHVLFEGFREPSIGFPPTFRFASDGSYSTKRLPAYTDRVLFRSTQSLEIDSTLYKPPTDRVLSDHKPIRACFSIRPHAYEWSFSEDTEIHFSGIHASYLHFPDGRIAQEPCIEVVLFPSGLTQFLRFDSVVESSTWIWKGFSFVLSSLRRETSMFFVVKDAALFGEDDLIGYAVLELPFWIGETESKIHLPLTRTSERVCLLTMQVEAINT